MSRQTTFKLQKSTFICSTIVSQNIYLTVLCMLQAVKIIVAIRKRKQHSIDVIHHCVYLTVLTVMHVLSTIIKINFKQARKTHFKRVDLILTLKVGITNRIFCFLVMCSYLKRQVFDQQSTATITGTLQFPLIIVRNHYKIYANKESARLQCPQGSI